MFDTSHAWFRPLWIRVLLLALSGGWGLVELATGSPGFAVIFLGIAGWVLWALFLTYAPAEQTREDDGDNR